ncbi:MAG: hypothetical protein ACMXYD_00540 [Candidatus Woesearchaeota archaeon]
MSESLRELARDFLALGSWIFYALVVVRALIEPYWEFATPVLITGALLLITQNLYAYEGYTARATALVYYTTQFYQDTLFSIFAYALLLGVPLAAYVNESTKKELALAILTTIPCIAVGVLISTLWI